MFKKQIGPHTGKAEDFKSYDELWNAFKTQLEYIIDVKMRGNLVIERIYAEMMPAPFLSICTDDCIKKGKDYNAGGARYNTSYIQGVGIGTISDALSSIKFNVFDNQKFTMKELIDAMNDDFKGHEDILNLVKNKTPKYGNDDDYADDIMVSVFNEYKDYITGRPTTRGGVYHVDMLPTTCHVYFGDVMIASPNGRLAHIPLSEGISPEKGADINGPTAVAALIRSYFAMNGHHMQFNVIDRQTLIEAQKNPEEYKELIVRVAGYSDYFRNLDKPLQNEIIERTEQSFGGCGCC